MAAYKVKNARAMFPYRYRQSNGAVATHETSEELLAVNERGGFLESYYMLEQGDVVYTDAASFDALTDEQKSGDTLYVPNSDFLGEHEKLGTIEKLESAPAKQAAPKAGGNGKAAGK